MKITSLETFPLNVPPAPGKEYWGSQAWKASAADADSVPLVTYPPVSRRRFLYAEGIQTVLVRIESADGVVGWGEAKAPVGARVTAALIDDLLAPLVIGGRLDEITLLWDRMYAGMRVRGHDAGFWLEALSGVDIALWDALARTVDQPVHVLLGGRYRDTVPVYASGIPAAAPGSGAAGLAMVTELADSYAARGFRAAKVAIGNDPATDLASVEAVCEVFGAGQVFADAAGTYDLPQALRVGRRLSELGVGFFEMPIAPEYLDGYATLAGKLDIPLALDSLSGRHRSLEFLRRGALQILQPDVCRAGGITELMRISALADSFGAQTTPHVSIGSAVHFAASLQCAAAMPNFSIMEHWAGDNPLGTAIAPEHQTPAHSRLAVGSAPGLGITVDETAVRSRTLR